MAEVAVRALAGGGARPLAVHFGAGIARRDDYNEQCAAHREALERGTVAPVRPALPVVAVPASSIVVAEGGSNYRPVPKSEGKQEKRARRRAKAAAAARHDARRRLAADGDVQPSLEGQSLVVTASDSEDLDSDVFDPNQRYLGDRHTPRGTSGIQPAETEQGPLGGGSGWGGSVARGERAGVAVGPESGAEGERGDLGVGEGPVCPLVLQLGGASSLE